MVRYLKERPAAQPKVGGGPLVPLRSSEYSRLMKALKDLYGFGQNSLTSEDCEELTSRILESRKKGLEAVLDKAGIEIALVNTCELRPELDPRRFRWVPFADQFLYPLKRSNTYLRSKASWKFERFEKELDFAYQKAAVKPETLEDYVSFVEDQLKEYRKRGAVGVKLWSAFFRSLSFRNGVESGAKEVFSKYSSKRKIKEEQYTKLQDFIAFKILSSCAELGLPVHVHVGFGLATKVISLGFSSPLNLENIVQHEDLEKLKVVLIHGGYPYVRESGSLAGMNDNVFIDFSWLPVLIPPHDLSYILREWIAWKLDEKLLFGTDAVDTPWATDELLCVYGAEQARDALTLALSGMVTDSLLTDEEATKIAERAMRENALEIYGL